MYCDCRERGSNERAVDFAARCDERRHRYKEMGDQVEQSLVCCEGNVVGMRDLCLRGFELTVGEVVCDDPIMAREVLHDVDPDVADADDRNNGF